MMKKWWVGWLVAVACWTGVSGQAAPTFDDIEFWVGSGANQAALVIDWNDGLAPESMLWGFRWDGSATGLTMMQAITAADSRFGGVVMTDHGWGWTVDGIGYDLDGDGFDIGDPDDHYNPGWDGANWWAYSTYDGVLTPWDIGEVWTSSMIGLADRVLSDGSWDGWRYGSDGSGSGVPVPASLIPEPASLGLVALALAALAVRRRG